MIRRIVSFLLIVVLGFSSVSELGVDIYSKAETKWDIIGVPDTQLDSIYSVKGEDLIGKKDNRVSIVSNDMKTLRKSAYDQIDDMLYVGDDQHYLLVSKYVNTQQREYAIIAKDGRETVKLGKHNDIQVDYIIDDPDFMVLVVCDLDSGSKKYGLYKITGEVILPIEYDTCEYIGQYDYLSKKNGKYERTAFDNVKGNVENVTHTEKAYTKIWKGNTPYRGIMDDKGNTGILVDNKEFAMDSNLGEISKNTIIEGCKICLDGKVYYLKAQFYTEDDAYNLRSTYTSISDIQELLEWESTDKKFSFYDENQEKVDFRSILQEIVNKREQWIKETQEKASAFVVADFLNSGSETLESVSKTETINLGEKYAINKITAVIEKDGEEETRYFMEGYDAKGKEAFSGEILAETDEEQQAYVIRNKGCELVYISENYIKDICQDKERHYCYSKQNNTIWSEKDSADIRIMGEKDGENIWLVADPFRELVKECQWQNGYFLLINKKIELFDGNWSLTKSFDVSWLDNEYTCEKCDGGVILEDDRWIDLITETGEEYKVSKQENSDLKYHSDVITIERNNKSNHYMECYGKNGRSIYSFEQSKILFDLQSRYTIINGYDVDGEEFFLYKEEDSMNDVEYYGILDIHGKIVVNGKNLGYVNWDSNTSGEGEVYICFTDKNETEYYYYTKAMDERKDLSGYGKEKYGDLLYSCENVYDVGDNWIGGVEKVMDESGKIWAEISLSKEDEPRHIYVFPKINKILLIQSFWDGKEGNQLITELPSTTPIPTKVPKNAPTEGDNKTQNQSNTTVTGTTKKEKQSFVAVPAKVTLKNKKAKKMIVSWKKVKGAKGYQIQYATNKKYKKGKKITTRKTKYTIKKLKKKKTYYVRVRAYTVNNGKKVYGKWSKVKKVKIKK